jgi:hypothetical protein
MSVQLFGPSRLFDHLVGVTEKGQREGEAKRFAAFMLRASSTFVTCCTGKSAGLRV